MENFVRCPFVFVATEHAPFESFAADASRLPVNFLHTSGMKTNTWNTAP